MLFGAADVCSDTGRLDSQHFCQFIATHIILVQTTQNNLVNFRQCMKSLEQELVSFSALYFLFNRRPVFPIRGNIDIIVDNQQFFLLGVIYEWSDICMLLSAAGSVFEADEHC